MQTVDTLRAEHDAVLLVLTYAERAAAAAARGVAVPTDIFADIQEFFAVFVDGCHHSKEEAAVFPHLVSSADASALVRQLEAEHDAGRRLARAFAQAVAAYRPGDAATGARLAEATRSYAALLRRHIEEENTALFPAMERSLTADDAAIQAQFDLIEAEDLGVGTHERLHAMIDTLESRVAAVA